MILLAGYSCPVASQSTVDTQLWSDFTLVIPETKHLSWGGDVGVRGITSNTDWNQLVVRPTVRYRWNQVFSVAGAVAAFATFNIDDDNVMEYRMHQESTIDWPNFGVFSVKVRMRLEQRWFFYDSASLDNSFDLRGRILTGLESQDFRLGEGKRPFYFEALWEGFRSDRSDSHELFINQSRIYGIFGHRLDTQWRYEIQYIWQQSRQYAENGLKTSQNIVRIRFFYRLPEKSATSTKGNQL